MGEWQRMGKKFPRTLFAKLSVSEIIDRRRNRISLMKDMLNTVSCEKVS